MVQLVYLPRRTGHLPLLSPRKAIIGLFLHKWYKNIFVLLKKQQKKCFSSLFLKMVTWRWGEERTAGRKRCWKLKLKSNPLNLVKEKNIKKIHKRQMPTF